VAVCRNDDNKKLRRVISTKLSIEDHKTFRLLTNLTYQYGGIEEDSTSEMLRYLISPVVELLRKQPDFHSYDNHSITKTGRNS
jgi:hypothetical protein